MKLEVLPARKGDCLILHCGTEEAPGLILIDGGPAGTYADALRDRLMELRTERRLAEDKPLVINLVLVSHVDDDHIVGVLDLFQEMKARARDGDPPLFVVERLWHNSFDHIIGNDETSAFLASSQFGAAATHGAAEAIAEEADEELRDALKILASLPNGDLLRELASDPALDVPINPEFDDELIQSTVGQLTTAEVEGVTFTILGPRRPELQRLQTDFDEWFRNRPRNAGNAASFLAAYGRETVTNLSSIVAVAEDSDGKRILLTGDARGDKVLKGATETGLLEPDGTYPVEIMKLPHHGSAGNIQPDFLIAFPARHYVFSGNGKHGNPERKAAEMVLERPQPTDLVFSYRLGEIDEEREAELERERARQRDRGRPVAPEWSAGRDSLEALLRPPPPQTTVTEPGADPILL